jgi:hypothetical protein
VAGITIASMTVPAITPSIGSLGLSLCGHFITLVLGKACGASGITLTARAASAPLTGSYRFPRVREHSG